METQLMHTVKINMTRVGSGVHTPQEREASDQEMTH